MKVTRQVHVRVRIVVTIASYNHRSIFTMIFLGIPEINSVHGRNFVVPAGQCRKAIKSSILS